MVTKVYTSGQRPRWSSKVSSESQTTSLEGFRAGGAGDATAGLLVDRVAAAVIAGAEARAVEARAVEVPLAGAEARAAELLVPEVLRARAPGVGALVRRMLCILLLVLPQLRSSSLIASESPLPDRSGGMITSERNWYVGSINRWKDYQQCERIPTLQARRASKYFFSRRYQRKKAYSAELALMRSSEMCLCLVPQ